MKTYEYKINEQVIRSLSFRLECYEDDLKSESDELEYMEWSVARKACNFDGSTHDMKEISKRINQAFEQKDCVRIAQARLDIFKKTLDMVGILNDVVNYEKE